MNKPVNSSLLRKSAARVAAVQYLFGYAEHTQGEYVATLKKQLAGNLAEQKLLFGGPYEPHYPLLEALLEGVAQRQEDIDARLTSVLTQDWKRERMSALLIAILQCAIFELFFYKDAKPAVIIDEYTRLTGRFFDEAETNFVYAALGTLATRYTP
jgi:N utilization substance protein B